MSCFTAAGTLLPAAGAARFTATTSVLIAAATAAEADTFAMEAAEALFVDAAISVIVHAAFAATIRAAAGRTLSRFIRGLVDVFITIAHAAIAACSSYSIAPA